MKTPVFTVTGVMACLMLLSRPVNAQITAGATFNLQAELKRATCNALTFSGDADSTGNVDFGIFSNADGDVKKTKQVVLTLRCESAPPPSVAQIGFNIIEGSNEVTEGRLLTKAPSEQISDNVYYDWKWGQKINDTVEKDTGLSPGQPVILGGDRYIRSALVQGEDRQEWAFPLDITLKTITLSGIDPGDYGAVVQVNILYE